MSEWTRTAEDHPVSLWELLEEERMIAHKLACSCDRHIFFCQFLRRVWGSACFQRGSSHSADSGGQTDSRGYKSTTLDLLPPFHRSSAALQENLESLHVEVGSERFQGIQSTILSFNDFTAYHGAHVTCECTKRSLF